MTYSTQRIINLTSALIISTAAWAASSSAMAQSLFNPTPAVTIPAHAAQPVAQEKTVAAKPAAKPKAKPAAKKPAQAANAGTVLVVNKRKVALLELVVTSTKSDDAKPQTIATDLAGGKRKSAALTKNGGCVYDISGVFSDETVVEVNGADLCKDSTISLVD